jgi:hypothetical protein
MGEEIGEEYEYIYLRQNRATGTELVYNLRGKVVAAGRVNLLQATVMPRSTWRNIGLEGCQPFEDD